MSLTVKELIAKLSALDNEQKRRPVYIQIDDYFTKAGDILIDEDGDVIIYDDAHDEAVVVPREKDQTQEDLRSLRKQNSELGAGMQNLSRTVENYGKALDEILTALYGADAISEGDRFDLKAKYEIPDYWQK